ncbi:MAG: DUF1553 domain-containing protein [Planctomycetaceae bacterium]|nr:DUF1553 domain-containing protein [Planctomycetaceae bacterium]
MTISVDRIIECGFRYMVAARSFSFLALAVCLPASCLIATPGRAAEKVVFSRDVLPLLSDKCFQCHGPDEANREAGLRLDEEAGAFAELDSGERAIVAKDPDSSALIQRVTTDDPDLRMPPPESGKSLTPAEVKILSAWIDQGAGWSKHWSFQAPVQSSVPGKVSAWQPVGPIDHFIHDRIRLAGLEPEGLAEKENLIRRVTLDLIGLPPTIQDVDDFLADQSPNAYERVVDRLLDSARYGEHMARIWLDAARFADTHGLHLDNERSIWPYRDWVIAAFNKNMPFDQFTIEQLAGDLLPNPTLSQRVATGFNRCNVTTSEGGSIDDEYYVRYAVDRVETTSTVWLGLTAGCAACHDHKFDPLTQREFYQLFSYFFSLTEKAMDGNALLPPPSVKVPSLLQSRRKDSITKQLAKVNSGLEALHKSVSYTDPMRDATLRSITEVEVTWLDDKLPEGAEVGGDGEDPWQFVKSSSDHPVWRGEKSTVRTADGLSQQFFTKATPPLRIGIHDRLFTYVYLDPENPPETVQLQFNDGSWDHRAYWGADKGHNAGKKGAANYRVGDLPELGKWVRLEVAAGAVGLADGAKLNGWSFAQFKGTVHWDQAGVVVVSPPSETLLESQSVWEQFRGRSGYPALPAEIQKVLDLELDKRDGNQQTQLRRHFLSEVNPKTRVPFQEPYRQRRDLTQKLAELEKAIPATLVMEERKEPRQAHVLERGEYTLKRDKVASRLPEWVSPIDPNWPANRLGLSQWLVSPEHPLTARVTVNRFWQQFFGTGLVKTSEDFGVQGEQPSHPELLDWLSIDFIKSEWNVKRFLKQIVMSRTYRQSSRVTAEKLSLDPDNRWLARGPRFRLDAEVIRDQALSISGLLVDTIGGKSVRPYQPAGLWKPVGFGGSNTSVFKQDAGSNLYRRSMYTFWKRTSPPPSMTTFDAPDRETCQVRRARTNTPLQALVLMNDVQFVEAARKLAERVIIAGGPSDEDRMIYAFRCVTSRRPHEKEKASLMRLLADYRAEFGADVEAAKRLIAVGESGSNDSLNPVEVGAWTMITHLLMNLNETVTKA